MLFGSCRSQADNLIVEPPPGAPEPVRSPAPYIITDWKNRTQGEAVPEWVNLWTDSGERGVETLDAFGDRYVFVARNEANNFNALNLWKDGFSAELDFPRLASARMEARMASTVDNPEQSYGAFYEAMIRGVSDFPWTGAVIEDDFWIRRQLLPSGETVPEEEWEFRILVSIERSLFTSQLDRVFERVNPSPSPTRDQRTAFNSIREQFLNNF